MSSFKINTVILGASGYTGAELIRLLCSHPHIEISQLAAEKSAGQTMAELFPNFYASTLPVLCTTKEINWTDVNLAFCCLPHGASQEVISAIPNHVRIIDLSADFRLRDPNAYETWYGAPHAALELQRNAVYGLSEIYTDPIRIARLVANPGCYPTATSLPLIPLLKKSMIKTDSIIVDAKSGISGAGRSLKQANLFCELNENLRAYSVSNHRHIPEIEQTLKDASQVDMQIEFTPQVVPMTRGMVSMIYVELEKNQTPANLRSELESFYAPHPFVDICNDGIVPTPKDVVGTNHCRIAVVPGRSKNRAILISVIDNLIKGASGQALQNFNIMFGCDETLGLSQQAIFP